MNFFVNAHGGGKTGFCAIFSLPQGEDFWGSRPCKILTISEVSFLAGAFLWRRKSGVVGAGAGWWSAMDILMALRFVLSGAAFKASSQRDEALMAMGWGMARPAARRRGPGGAVVAAENQRLTKTADFCRFLAKAGSFSRIFEFLEILKKVFYKTGPVFLLSGAVSGVFLFSEIAFFQFAHLGGISAVLGVAYASEEGIIVAAVVFVLHGIAVADHALFP